MGWAILTLKQFFSHGFPSATSHVVGGGLVQAAVTPSAPSYPVCDDGFVGGGFCSFSVAFWWFPFVEVFIFPEP